MTQGNKQKRLNICAQVVLVPLWQNACAFACTSSYTILFQGDGDQFDLSGIRAYQKIFPSVKMMRLENHLQKQFATIGQTYLCVRFAFSCHVYGKFMGKI